MMIPEMGVLVNRTSRVLVARFDGKDFELQPGENMVPKVIFPYAKNQHILMGSEAETDPSDVISLVGVPGRDDCSPLEQDKRELTRVRLQDVVGEGVTILTRGKPVRSAFEAAVPVPGGDNLGILNGSTGD